MQQKISRVPWIDYLRGFITLLVVAHHSSLAYTSWASFNKTAYILSTHPVVDTVRSKGLDIFEDFNDIFFMPLMFLISGIFVLRSIEGKGRGTFIQERLRRLGLPFIVGVTLLMLIAYYPAWLLAHHGAGAVGTMGGGSGTGMGSGGIVRTGIGAYIVDFFTVEAWPVGPPWFLWVLLAFNGIFVWVYPYVKDTLIEWSQALSKIRTPLELILLGYIITWVLYIPMMSWAGADAWTGIGPFDFQISRILLYFGYFIVGVVMGGGFVNGTMFVEKWRHWVGGCLLVFILLKCSEAPLRWMVGHHQIREQAAQCIYRSMWCLSCVLSCMAFLVVFKNIFQRARPWWNSLSANAYGIYLVHYIFVIWCQYLLLGMDLPALAKFLISFVLSAAASWTVTAAVRLVPGIKKVL